MRMTLDLFDELSNAEICCFFHNCMWQFWYSEVIVYFLEVGGLLSTHGSHRSCLIRVFVSVYNLYRHWHTTLDGFWSIHGSHRFCWVLDVFVTKQDISWVDSSTHGSSRSWSLGFWFWLESLGVFAASSYFWIHFFHPIIFEGNIRWWSKWKKILFLKWFLQIPSQQLSRCNKLGVYRKGWSHYILFDRISILFVEQVVISTHYGSWCFIHFFCLCHGRRGASKSISYGSLWSLSMGFTAVKNTVCLSLLEYWWSVYWLHIQYEKCFRRKCSESIHFLQCRRSMRLRPWNILKSSQIKNFLFWRISTVLKSFLLLALPAILLFHTTSDKHWECSNSFRR